MSAPVELSKHNRRDRHYECDREISMPENVVRRLSLAGSAISCFECHSLDGDMQACEDEFAPYNVTGHLYRRDCTVGHLDFEAFYCIKIKGVKSTHQFLLTPV